MTCPDRALVSGYLDEALSPRQKVGLLAHIEQCSDCAQTLARYRQIELLLRRLPVREPSPESRDKLLQQLLSTSHPRRWQWARAIAAAVVIAVIGVGVASSRQVAPPLLSDQSSVSVDTLASQPTFASQASSGQSVSLPATYANDAALLQQVSRSVRRPGFRPLLPGYLPNGAKLTNVNLRPNNPGGPIDRLELAYVTSGNRLQLRQESAEAASFETQRILRGGSERLLTAGGHEWRFVRQDPVEGRTAPTVLIGSRDGTVIWLESSLPLEELEKIAASLQE